jgi:hypothetical protein
VALHASLCNVTSKLALCLHTPEQAESLLGYYEEFSNKRNVLYPQYLIRLILIRNSLPQAILSQVSVCPSFKSNAKMVHCKNEMGIISFAAVTACQARVAYKGRSVNKM